MFAGSIAGSNRSNTPLLPGSTPSAIAHLCVLPAHPTRMPVRMRVPAKAAFAGAASREMRVFAAMSLPSVPSVIEPPVIEIAPPATQRRWAIAFGLYTAATNLIFTQGVWVISLSIHGFSPFAIGLFETCFHVAKFLAEAPTGIFADLVGRRLSLIVSALLVVVAELLFLAPTPTLIAISFGLRGSPSPFAVAPIARYCGRWWSAPAIRRKPYATVGSSAACSSSSF